MSSHHAHPATPTSVTDNLVVLMIVMISKTVLSVLDINSYCRRRRDETVQFRRVEAEFPRVENAGVKISGKRVKSKAGDTVLCCAVKKAHENVHQSL